MCHCIDNPGDEILFYGMHDLYCCKDKKYMYILNYNYKQMQKY